MFDRDAFIEDCRRALLEHSPRRAMKEVVERAVASPRDLERAFPLTEAGFTPLHHAPDLTIIHFVWGPEMTLFPHNHTMWAVIGIYGGQEENTFYRRAPGGLHQTCGRTLLAGDAVVLGQDVIHAVSNPQRSFTTAIHVYGGDFFTARRKEWDPVTFEDRPFSFEHLRQAFADSNKRAKELARG
jgi:predicted metal-dependent enzyme (double-stranded beta helix superfamily)